MMKVLFGLLSYYICILSYFTFIVAYQASAHSSHFLINDEPLEYQKHRSNQPYVELGDPPLRNDATTESLNSHLREVVLQSIYGCRLVDRLCPDTLYTVEPGNFFINVVQEGTVLTDDDFEYIAGRINAVFSVRNIPVVLVSNAMVSDLDIHIGSPDYLLWASRQSISSPHSEAHFLSLRRSNPELFFPINMFWEGPSLGYMECYQDTSLQDDLGKTIIFISYRNLRHCLPRSLMVSVGLYEVVTDVDSVMSLENDVNTLTPTDHLMIDFILGVEIGELESVRELREAIADFYPE